MAMERLVEPQGRVGSVLSAAGPPRGQGAGPLLQGHDAAHRFDAGPGHGDPRQIDVSLRQSPPAPAPADRPARREQGGHQPLAGDRHRQPRPGGGGGARAGPPQPGGGPGVVAPAGGAGLRLAVVTDAVSRKKPSPAIHQTGSLGLGDALTFLYVTA